MFPTTFDTETELSSVNSILGSIGQAPVQRLEFENPEISFVYQLLKEANVDVQSEGWHFNSEFDYPLTPNADGHIVVPENVIRMDFTEGKYDKTWDVVKRNGVLYDKIGHTDIFPQRIFYFDILWLFPYEDLPTPFKRYITSRAAGRAAAQMVNNSELVKLLQSQELQARAACMEYECNQGDQNMMGHPAGSYYKGYEPFMALRRY